MRLIHLLLVLVRSSFVRALLSLRSFLICAEYLEKFMYLGKWLQALASQLEFKCRGQGGDWWPTSQVFLGYEEAALVLQL